MLSACASQPEDITATYETEGQYAAYTCGQLSTERGRISARTSELHAALAKKANNDAVQMGVGLVLFWPTLFFLEGGDGAEAAEYARLRGQKDALDRAIITKVCQ